MTEIPLISSIKKIKGKEPVKPTRAPAPAPVAKPKNVPWPKAKQSAATKKMMSSTRENIMKGQVAPKGGKLEPIDVVKKKVRRYYYHFPRYATEVKGKKNDDWFRAELARIREELGEKSTPVIASGLITAAFQAVEQIDKYTNVFRSCDLMTTGLSTAYSKGLFEEIGLERDVMEIMIEYNIGYTHPLLRFLQKMMTATRVYSEARKQERRGVFVQPPPQCETSDR